MQRESLTQKIFFQHFLYFFLNFVYDLTYSNTYYGEHTTSVDGNGRNPGRKELLAVGTGAGMKKTRCEEIIDEIEKKVKEMLEEYLLGK